MREKKRMRTEAENRERKTGTCHGPGAMTTTKFKVSNGGDFEEHKTRNFHGIGVQLPSFRGQRVAFPAPLVDLTVGDLMRLMLVLVIAGR